MKIINTLSITWMHSFCALFVLRLTIYFDSSLSIYATNAVPHPNHAHAAASAYAAYGGEY